MKNQINYKNKNKIRVFFIISLVIALSISLVYSQGTTNVSVQNPQSAEFILGNEFKADSSLDKKTQESLTNINDYANENWNEISGSKGKVKIENGEIMIFTADNNQFAKIPPGYIIEKDLKDLKKFLVKNNFAASDSVLEIENNKFKIKNSAEISYSKNKDIESIELNGKGDIQFKERKFDAVQDGKFRLGKSKEIISAAFTSVNGGKYEFETKLGKYIFDVKKGGEVNYDKDGEISGKKAILFLPDGSKLETGEFSGKFDENGNLNSLLTTGSSKYTDKNGNLYSAENLNIYGPWTNPGSITGNAIFFAKDNEIILKGVIQSKNERGLTYNGYSENTLTKYNPNINSFDVKGGDAKISNGENTITYANGKASIEKDHLISSKNAESFITRYESTDGKILTTVIDKSSGSLYLSTIENGKTTETAIVPLDDFEGNLNNVKAIEETHVNRLQSVYEDIKETASKEQLDALQLSIENAKNRNLNPSEAIENINKYLESERTSTSELNAKMALAELYTKRAANPEVPIGTDILDWIRESRKQSINDYIEAENLYKSIKESSIEIDKVTFEAASFGLAETYRKSGDISSATKEYFQLVDKGSSKETISNAYLGVAQIKIENGDYGSALINIDESRAINPDNTQAAELQQQLRAGILRNVRTGLEGDTTNVNNLFSSQLGSENFRSWSETPWEGIKSVLFNSGRIAYVSGGGDRILEFELGDKLMQINSQSSGTMAFQAVNAKGYDLNEFANADFNSRKQIIADSMGFDYVDEEELKQAFIKDYKKTHTGEYAEKYIEQNYLDENGYLSRYSAARDDFIKQMKGETVAITDKIIYDFTENSFEVQKNPDIKLLLNPETSSEFNFQTGKGYIDPGYLQKTWRDSVLDQINLANAALIVAPGATISVAGRTMSVAGWIGTGANAIPGVETGIQAINTARLGAAEALGLKAVAEIFPKTASAGNFVSREIANYQLGTIITEAVPGGQYIAPFVSINPSTNGLGAAREIADDIATSGAKITLRDLVRVEEGNAQFAPRFFATTDDMQTISSNARRLGIDEIKTLESGVKIFEKDGRRFSIFPEDYTPSITPSSAGLMKKTESQYEMLDSKYSTTPQTVTEATSQVIADKQAEIAQIVETSNGPFSIRGMTSDQIQEMGIETRKFYAVTSDRTAERLKAGGIIETAGGETFSWPTAPERAHLGTGFYSWDNLESAATYRKLLETEGKTGLNIIEVQFSERTISKLKSLDIDSLGEKNAQEWLNSHSYLFSDNPSQVMPHNLDHITRGTNLGTENYFTPEIFQKGTVTQVLK